VPAFIAAETIKRLPAELMDVVDRFRARFVTAR
jgi:hypothetical protein